MGSIGAAKSTVTQFTSAVDFRKAIEKKYELRNTGLKGQYFVVEDGSNIARIRFSTNRFLKVTEVLFHGWDAKGDDYWMPVSTLEGFERRLR